MIKDFMRILFVLILMSFITRAFSQDNQMNMSKKIKPSLMSLVKAKVLIEDSNAVYQSVISEKMDYGIYFVGEDGIIILREDGGTYYRENRSEVLALLETPAKLIVNNEIPYGNQFPLKTTEFIDTLQNKLKIDKDKLDFTLASLKEVDICINKIKWNNSLELEDELLFPIVAYVGEILVKSKIGTWEIREYKEEEGIFRDIIINAGDGAREYEIQFAIIQEFNNYKKNISIYDTVLSELNKYKLIDYMKKLNK